MIVCARQGCLSISETDILGFPCTIVSSWQRFAQHDSMDPAFLVSTLHASGGGVTCTSAKSTFPVHNLSFVSMPQPAWVSLLTVCIPLWLQSTHLLIGTSSRIARRVTKHAFRKRNDEFSALRSPPRSPDLDPIEHLWDAVEEEVLGMNVQLTNVKLPGEHDPASLRNVSRTLSNPIDSGHSRGGSSQC